MDWVLIVTHAEIGQPSATAETIRESVSQFRRDEAIGFVLRLLEL